MRDLASIISVKEVWPLKGKDRVQGCNFNENGYEAMVGKDIQPGDKVCFIQEGAILPVLPEWEFLRKRCFKESLNGFLIKPQKFCDIKSWGLVVSLKDLPLKNKDYKIGDDLTDALEILKYEDAEEASPSTKQKKCWWKSLLCNLPIIGKFFIKFFKKYYSSGSTSFPTNVISKSDETTLQNMISVLEKHKGERFYISAKMEGQSGTCFIDFTKKDKKKRIYICGRNTRWTKEKSDNIFWKCFRKYDLERKLKDYYKKTGEILVLQFEQVGPKIQENIYNFKDNKWFVYTMKNLVTGKQYDFTKMESICKELGLETVPINPWTYSLGECKFKTVDDFVKFAEDTRWVKDNETDIVFTRFSNEFTAPVSNISHLPKSEKSIQHEGIVVRSTNYDKDNNIGFSFKVKNMDYQEKGIKKLHQMCIENFG